MNVSIYIGIDPGTHCGWGILNASGERLSSGVWNLSTKRHEGGGMRFVRLHTYLEQLYTSYFHADVSMLIGYEEVRRHMGVDAAHIYGGIIAVISQFCEEHQIPYAGIPVGTIKKTATGSGKASKDDMISTANIQWDINITDDNEADALWISETLRKDLVNDS